MASEHLCCIFDDERVELVDSRTGRQPVKYPFDLMEVGTSFRVNRTKSALWSAIRKYRKEVNKERRFVVRSIEGGSRVWRIK